VARAPWAAAAGAALLAGSGLEAEQNGPRYDLLLRGGHLVDPRSGTSAVRDVAVADGHVAAVEPQLDPVQALKTIDVSGLYLTPGLVDIHAHVYAGTGERDSYAGDNSVYPDGFTLRAGVTSVVDAGGAGWRNFEDFRQRIAERSRTRVLAFLNIVGHGMRGGRYEQDLADMDPRAAAEAARRHPGLIVGIKTAHYAGPEWAPVERAVEAGRRAGLPVMVDFGEDRPERPLGELLTRKLRPGDIYTHVYSGLRGELDATGRVDAGLWEGRRRGVLLDVGHGGGSFVWRVAVPALREGLRPDSISTDLHVASMNAGMKDMLNVASKFLALGLSIEEVVLAATWGPARAIRREDLGHVAVGGIADLAVLRLEQGRFGYVDSYGARLDGTHKLVCELTLREGKVVYDLNGISRPAWDVLPADYRSTGDPRWDGTRR
jgi:dihydroorotase